MSNQWQWTDARTLCVEGQAWCDTKEPYARLPARAEGKVRDVIWNLSRQTPGVTVRFESNSPQLSARWTLADSTLSGRATPVIAHSGLDLYARSTAGNWRWVGCARDIAGTNAETVLTFWGDLEPGWHEFLVYLPLHNPVLKLDIGITTYSAIRTVTRRSEKPIAYYGTSIVHGAGVSRSGMTHPAILGRRLDYPLWNLGFSGNAQMEPEVATLFAELDPVFYILDALPNMDATMINNNAESFVRTLAAARPGTPIVLVEDRTYPAGWITPGARTRNATSRAAFQAVYGKLLAAGIAPMHYIEGNGLLGLDGDGTNDGSHPNDLGAARMADAFEPVLRKLLTGVVN